MKISSLIGIVSVLSGLAVNAHLAASVQSDITIPVGMTKSQQDRLEQVAGASLFGQFRSNMADFLWMKVDKYLHSGVDLRGITEEEKESLRTELAKNSGGKIKDGNREHHGETTIVLSKQSDWRGFLGDVERDVKPYMSMAAHHHRDPKEALPLFRLMTWSNPHFVPGYSTGAVMMSRDKKAFGKAVQFLAEGEANNPESIDIQDTYGFLLLSFRNAASDPAAAARHAERGIALAKQRDPKTLTAEEKESWQSCVRWRVLAYREMKASAKARQAALDGMRDFPDDVTCRTYLKGS